MSTTQSLLDELKSKGSEKARITYARHGIPIDRTFGVSVADLKLIAKKIKGRQTLALDLYETGSMDAMYLAGMVADGALMTPAQFQSWATGAVGMPMIAEYTVPWVTVENPHARDLANQWIKSAEEQIACSGWCTWSGLVATRSDDTLDLAELEDRLAFIVSHIQSAKNRVRLTMNGFVIAVGTYVKPLLSSARSAAEKINLIAVDMGDTACKVRFAIDAIAKVESAGKVGQKKKTIRC